MLRSFRPSREGPRAGARRAGPSLGDLSRDGGNAMKTEVLLTGPLSELASAHARLRGDARRLPDPRPVRVAPALAASRATRQRLIAAGLLVPPRAHAEGAT